MQYHQSESHHKELAACTDEQLCAMAAAGDREAEELLVTRYYGMVRACARPLFLAGGDGEDLIQEGMFGLIQAIREYDADKAASFHTYAEICIRSRLFSALRIPIIALFKRLRLLLSACHDSRSSCPYSQRRCHSHFPL